MKSADRFLSGFAKTWRNEQKRLSSEFSRDDHAAYFAAVEQAWRAICQQWWNNLRHVVPQPLTNQLEAAISQTQLCMSLALHGEQISAADLASILNPVVGLHAAMLAHYPHGVEQPNDVARAHLRASQAMMGRVAQITQSALTAAHEQLRDNHQRTPRELYSYCAHAVEDLYREQAGNDEFVQLIGNWVNAHVKVIAARRAATATGSDQRGDSPAERCGKPSGNALELSLRDRLHDSASEQSAHASATLSCAHAVSADPVSDRVTQQMREFSEKLAAGATSLATLPAGRSHGVSPYEVVLQYEGIKLLRYRGAIRKPLSGPVLPPLLLVYSLVNRPYILDLNEDRSLIRALCDGGRDVYLIDWGYPGEQEKALGLDDYINRYLHRCVTYLQTISDPGTVDLIGICQGGPFALCYAALEPARVRRLALMAAPFDFHTDDFLLARWMQFIDVDGLVSTLGNVPGHLLNWSFIALKPVSLSGMKALELLDLLDCPSELASYAQMEHWLQDNPDQAGKAFAEFTQTFVRENALVKASARIGTRFVDLRAVHHKVLNIYAARDHIVPPSASRSLPDLLTNARCTNHPVDCGHISVLAGRRTQSEVPRVLHEWFDRAD